MNKALGPGCEQQKTDTHGVFHVLDISFVVLFKMLHFYFAIQKKFCLRR